ncbi:MAG: peptide-methionine (R)-S-oxide reductase MsrB [Anaerolineae bacterium]
MSTTDYRKPSPEDLARTLTPIQYAVTQRAGTEPPFQNAYWNHHDEGLYVDVTTGEPLFTSRDKFESGTGWPSFTRPVEEGRVTARVDTSHGMRRTEARSAAGDAHLGHVFEDGPRRRGCGTASTRPRCASCPSPSWRRPATVPTSRCSPRRVPPRRRPPRTTRAPSRPRAPRPAASRRWRWRSWRAGASGGWRRSCATCPACSRPGRLQRRRRRIRRTRW